MSLTLPIWKELKAEAERNGGTLTPKQVLPFWNRAMELVSDDGKTVGAIELCNLMKQEMERGKKITI